VAEREPTPSIVLAKDGAIVKELKELVVYAAEVQPSSPRVDRSQARARVAETLLVDPALGVTRIQYVGLPENEAVSTLVAGRSLGLDARATRRGYGPLNVTFAAPAYAVARAESEDWPPVWLRGLWNAWRARGERFARHLGRRA
jgi:hypothetical protein